MVSWENDLSTRSASSGRANGPSLVKNQVNECVSGLHCTWLVPHTRASSDDVDELFTLRVDTLEEGRSTEAALMCLDSLKLPSCARNPHASSSISFVKIISSKRSGAQQATEVLGQEFFDQISLEGHMFMFYLFRLEPSVKFLFMLSLPKGTQMPYSAAVDLVAQLGVYNFLLERSMKIKIV
ncbi:hypothetical protein M9H77_06464 [Catharanthus roseus]|uniref:Uncharacterized protein n=1 Tax=Catharanthus roseus TaxID=4058 RepID=A0ACC0BS76_CATRO|nr:hypothetical protein M9H77_06464 [Catharanthus roseus]